MNNTQSGNSRLASNPLKTFQTPNSGLAQNVISANLHSLHNPLGFVQILSVTAGYSQMKKDSVQAVLIQLHAGYISLRGSVTNYPDYIGLASRRPNTIGSVQRLPDDIGLVDVAPVAIGGMDIYKANDIGSVQRHNLVNDVHEVQPLGSISRDCSSLRASSLNQLPRLIPSLLANSDSCSLNSGWMRIWKAGALPSPFGLLSLLIVDMCVPITIVSNTLGTHINMGRPNKTMPRGALTLTGHLTTNDNLSIEEAMKDHITPVTGRNSFTPNIKFLWRFFSCQQSRYFTVEARSEQEARSMLPDAPCLFSARIHQGVNHA